MHAATSYKAGPIATLTAKWSHMCIIPAWLQQQCSGAGSATLLADSSRCNADQHHHHRDSTALKRVRGPP